MTGKAIHNGIFRTSIYLGSKTPFKDIQDDHDIGAAKEKILRDCRAHIGEIVDFVLSLKIVNTQKHLAFDDFIPEKKLRELGI